MKLADGPQITDWHNCYEGGWRDAIVPEAFAHPAKFSRSLIVRIIAHGLEQGYWKPGDLLGDPFGGVALGGIIAGYHGLNWLGVELEPRFVDLGNRNLALHGPRWMALGEATSVRLVQGDSRRFAAIVQGICNGQRVEAELHLHKIENANRQHDGDASRDQEVLPGSCGGEVQNSAVVLHPGQAGLSAVVTSPPYAEGMGHDISPRLDAKEDARREAAGMSRRTYGETPGQIGALKSGSLDGCVTSPPWVRSGTGSDKEANNRQVITSGTPTHRAGAEIGSTDYAKSRQELHNEHPYMSPGWLAKRKADAAQQNLGDLPDEAKDPEYPTYWSEMRKVYAQVHAALKPGGIMACVLKDYVKSRERVPLCDQSCTLLESLGFTVFERCRCWLVKEDRHPSLFGGDEVKTTERKSFFRRLAESKGSPRIDFEEVIWCRR